MNIAVRCSQILEIFNLLICHKTFFFPFKAYAIKVCSTSTDMLVTCRELNPVSAVSQVSSELQYGSNYSCLQHLASRFQLAVGVTSTKALKIFVAFMFVITKNVVELL